MSDQAYTYLKKKKKKKKKKKINIIIVYCLHLDNLKQFFKEGDSLIFFGWGEMVASWWAVTLQWVQILLKLLHSFLDQYP